MDMQANVSVQGISVVSSSVNEVTCGATGVRMACCLADAERRPEYPEGAGILHRWFMAEVKRGSILGLFKGRAAPRTLKP